MVQSWTLASAKDFVGWGGKPTALCQVCPESLYDDA